MSPLRVLGSDVVAQILISLSRPEILDVQQAIGKSLVDFSTGKEREYQPDAGVVRRPDGQKTLFRSFTSPTAVGAKIIVDPAPVPIFNNPDTQVHHGILALCDNQGIPTGIINAAEVTGYRTSMSTMIPYMWRRNTKNVVVFGSGKQALWHVRLALALRGSEIESITVVNRSEERAKSMLKQLKEENQQYWESPYVSRYLGPSLSDYDSQLEKAVSVADVIFCTVPSRKPLFPLHYMAKATEGGRYPFVSAIGSWQLDMIELDPNMLRYVVKSRHGYNSQSNVSGLIIVDNRDEVLHTGEFSQSNMSPEQTVELGEVLQWRKTSSSENKRLTAWLYDGFVIYKSVGVGSTDLACGNALLAIAAKRGLGVSIPDF
ncbi:MAG: hypothetical protein GOMPHAMPRED_002820 [Gomphillus americanus]|uniref:Thiomorpholine-carboxylate dehydrogenase n=1 Tax=Gomphillus americanus TaxID=1940652 RepID=A0A8H3FDQ3_9LECA|nr:MAG: hypothetical protein GOMPHAMPRED_002820 [Gomphillus americanus]